MHSSLLQHDEDEKENKRVCACCTSGRLTVAALVFAAFGLTLLILATYLPPLIQQKLNDGIDDFVSLAPKQMADNSKGFRTFANGADPDAVPIYQSFYMWNITNPMDVLNGSRPILTQHGPYVYREVKLKFDFSYSSDYNNKQLLQFKEWIYWEFQRDMTDSRFDPSRDKYMGFNVPFMAVTNAAGGALPLLWDSLLKQCPEYATSDYNRAFTSDRTVEEVLFGYSGACIFQNVPTSGMPAGFFPGYLGPNFLPNVNNTFESMGKIIEYDSIYTGSDDPDLVRQYYSWKGKTALGAWGSPDADRPYGTSGELFKRGLKDGSTIVAWVDDLMRHAPLINQNNEHVTDLHDLDLMRYVIDPKVLLNQTYVPANAAYYQTQYNGLLDLQTIPSHQNLPIFMSKPHFLDADPWLQQNVVGMQPNPALHDTSLDVEPITGATMRASKRLQINMRQQPFSFTPLGASAPVVLYAGVHLHYTPAAWIDEHAQIPTSQATKFREQVYGAQDAIKYVRLLGTIFGSVCLALAVHLLIVAGNRKAPLQEASITSSSMVRR